MLACAQFLMQQIVATDNMFHGSEWSCQTYNTLRQQIVALKNERALSLLDPCEHIRVILHTK